MRSFPLSHGVLADCHFQLTSIDAKCPNNVCTQAIDPSKINAEYQGTPSYESICEDGGGVEGGDVQWTSKSSTSIASLQSLLHVPYSVNILF